MQYSDFIGEVQHRLELPTEGEAVRATRVVLTTLARRIDSGEADDLAASLPMEIDRYLTEPRGGEQFSYQTFVERVADGANVGESDAHHYARTVVALVAEYAPGGEVAEVRAQLPDDYEDLFEFVESEATPW